MSNQDNDSYTEYFAHLQNLSFVGKTYHKFLKLPLIMKEASKFGDQILEVGSGIANGILGAYPAMVEGIDINPHAVRYCKEIGVRASLITGDGSFPVEEDSVDVCVLDNVLEHIADPAKTIDECFRVTRKSGALIIVVPGHLGYSSDSDHKVFYGEKELRNLSGKWSCTKVYALPFLVKSNALSEKLRQYCLVAVYTKRIAE